MGESVNRRTRAPGTSPRIGHTIHGFSTRCSVRPRGSTRNGIQTRPAGFEPATYGLGNRRRESVEVRSDNDLRAGAESFAAPAAAGEPDNPDSDAGDDPDLQTVVDAWPELPEAIRADILAVVRGARP